MRSDDKFWQRVASTRHHVGSKRDHRLAEIRHITTTEAIGRLECSKERGIPTARGGKCSAVQVARLLEAASVPFGGSTVEAASAAM